MPTALTETATFDASVPTPDDNELATGANFDGAFQPLANRTQYLRAILETTGAKLLRSVADVAALKALTGMASGEVAIVASSDAAYVYDSGSALASDDVLVVTPTTAPGRWKHVARGVADTAYGLATLSSAGKVVQPVPNRLVEVFSFKSASLSSSLLLDDVIDTLASTSYAYFPSLPSAESSTGGIKAGDIIRISGSIRFYSAAIAFARLLLIDGAIATTVLTECWDRCGAGETKTFGFSTVYTAAAGADRTVEVLVEGKTTVAASPVALMKPLSIVCEVWRP